MPVKCMFTHWHFLWICIQQEPNGCTRMSSGCAHLCSFHRCALEWEPALVSNLLGTMTHHATFAPRELPHCRPRHLAAPTPDQAHLACATTKLSKFIPPSCHSENLTGGVGKLCNALPGGLWRDFSFLPSLPDGNQPRLRSRRSILASESHCLTLHKPDTETMMNRPGLRFDQRLARFSTAGSVKVGALPGKPAHCGFTGWKSEENSRASCVEEKCTDNAAS